jgi:hypothetical protein
MASIDALRRQVAAMRARVDPPPEAHQWELLLEEGEELSEELRAQLGPHDQVCIRYYPKGYLGQDGHSTSGQVMSCWRQEKGGKLYPHLVRQYGVDISKV